MIVPILESPKESEQAYIMSLLNLFKSVATIVDYSQIATRIIPQLWKLSLDESLNIHHFHQISVAIDGLSYNARESHIKKLRAAESLQKPSSNITAANLNVVNLEGPIKMISPDTKLTHLAGSSISSYSASLNGARNSGGVLSKNDISAFERL
jgi:hypothetical protein